MLGTSSAAIVTCDLTSSYRDALVGVKTEISLNANASHCFAYARFALLGSASVVQLSRWCVLVCTISSARWLNHMKYTRLCPCLLRTKVMHLIFNLISGAGKHLALVEILIILRPCWYLITGSQSPLQELHRGNSKSWIGTHREQFGGVQFSLIVAERTLGWNQQEHFGCWYTREVTSGPETLSHVLGCGASDSSLRKSAISYFKHKNSGNCSPASNQTCTWCEEQ